MPLDICVPCSSRGEVVVASFYDRESGEALCLRCAQEGDE